MLHFFTSLEIHYFYTIWGCDPYSSPLHWVLFLISFGAMKELHSKVIRNPKRTPKQEAWRCENGSVVFFKQKKIIHWKGPVMQSPYTYPRRDTGPLALYFGEREDVWVNVSNTRPLLRTRREQMNLGHCTCSFKDLCIHSQPSLLEVLVAITGGDSSTYTKREKFPQIAGVIASKCPF